MKNFVFISYTSLFLGCLTGLVQTAFVPEFVTKAVLGTFFGISAVLFFFAALEELHWKATRRR
jgi:hypothetical protein